MDKTGSSYSVQVGKPYPLGATIEGNGVNFALFSEHAQKVELCLFSPGGDQEIARLELTECTDNVWHILVEDISAGALYGYRVHGPFDPQQGHRFNPHKLLLDPYAKNLHGPFTWSDEHYAYDSEDPSQDLSFDKKDNAHIIPKCVVTEELPPLKAMDKPVAWRDTVIYELHVKGFTQLHNRIPEALRGTYAGLAHDAVLEYLLDLGVTAVELLPVQRFIDEDFLVRRNLVNYWGYNTLNFFTPHENYQSTKQGIIEFRQMVDRFHEAGLEVILDVVYNHTAEGNHLGPTLCYRGIDNCAYYGLLHNDARFYVNDTGCGNTLNVKHPKVLQLVMDSLRYWATTMGVDGFRFDLATVLGREADGFDPFGGFLDAVGQDPVLNRKKLIAEPWDIGPGGYQLSQFPPGWAEWNDHYRDIVRRFWRGDAGMLPEFARRIHGSSDLFERAGRKPWASLNFVTSHDGFCLRDLVSYNQRHNHANKEQNNDGHHANFSYNFGVEGPTNNERIEAMRLRQQRNFLATLLLSQGTPMLLSGDELGRGQRGNNNVYCQDNELTWQNWEDLTERQWQLQGFVKNVLRVRREFPLLRSPFYIHPPEEQFKKAGYNIHWFSAQGQIMEEADWLDTDNHTLGWMLESVVNSQCVHCLLTLFNAGDQPTEFKLPGDWQWIALLDTATSDGLPEDRYAELARGVPIDGKALMVFYGLSSQCNIGVEPNIMMDLAKEQLEE